MKTIIFEKILSVFIQAYFELPDTIISIKIYQKESGRNEKVILYSNGDIYDGEYKDDQQNGNGLYTWQNGDKYQGNFLNEEKHGHGLFESVDGQIYMENFKKDNGTFRYLFNGNGLIKWPNGNKYEGDFLNDKRHGHGVYEYGIFYIKNL